LGLKARSRAGARGWYPVVATIQFRRSLRLLQCFEIETRVLAWDDKAFLIEQRFLRGEQPVAHALVRAPFLSRDGRRLLLSKCWLSVITRRSHQLHLIGRPSGTRSNRLGAAVMWKPRIDEIDEFASLRSQRQATIETV
jgi:Thioesterase-like superfamily